MTKRFSLKNFLLNYLVLVAIVLLVIITIIVEPKFLSGENLTNIMRQFGPLSFVSFVPSAYFTSAADPAFSGHGSTHADGDYEVHFGHFNGLSGRHALGVVTVRLEGEGQGHVNLSANSFWGGFYRADDGAAMAPSFAGAVVPVPEPASVAMLLAGLAAIGTAVRRRR